MPYNGSPEQRELLEEAMQRLHKERGVTDGEVVNAINRWAESDPKGNWSAVSVRTYNRYRLSGVRSYATGSLIYAFLSQGPDRFRVLSSALSGRRAFTDDQKFIDTILTHFPASGGGFDYDLTDSLTSIFELYRRSWRVRDGKHFMRSHLNIARESGVYRLTEYMDIDVQGTPIDETDEGWIFPYSSNFIGLTNSNECMKHYVFHQFFPKPQEDRKVEEMRGNLTAVAGTGPHPSSRILARRSKTGAVTRGHYHVDDFKDDKSMRDIIDYIMGTD